MRAAYAAYVYPTLAPLYAIAGLASVALLILEFGFHNPGEILPGRRVILPALIYFLLAYEVLSLAFSPGEQNFRSYVRAHTAQATVVVLVLALLLFRDEILAWLSAAGIAATENPAAASESAMLLFLSIGQVILLIGALMHLVRQPAFFARRALNPALIFVGSFALVIAVGFALLSLPRMQLVGLAWVDVLFITVSAVCVTGLSTVSITESFSPAGLALILLLIQIGGLGLMTLTSFLAFFLTGRASVSTKVLLRDVLSDEGVGRVKTLVRNIALLTFGAEAVGAVFLYFSMPPQLYANTAERVFAAIFHAVSAFCNAGFALHADGLGLLDRTLAGRLYVGGHMLLIVIGGLGFPVIVQLAQYAKQRRRVSLQLTTRLVLSVNAILLATATAAYFWFESGATLAGLDAVDRFWHSLFFAVSMRTAGFHTLPVAEMGLSMTFLAFLYMWIGASPHSTGGGIKTTTAGISFLHIVAQITGKNRVELYRKTVSAHSVNRAFATVALSLFVIFSGIFLLIATESGFAFVDIAFETVSAFGTVGLSRGITGELSAVGKIILCAIMLCGRVGVLTVLVAITPRNQPVAYAYPTEYVVVG